MESIKGQRVLGRRSFHKGVGHLGLFLYLSFSAKALAESGGDERIKLTGDGHVLVRRAYADGQDGQIHYRFAGSRELKETPLMCLHPSPMSGAVFDVWLAEMGRDRFVVAPDAPGYGGSDKPAKPPQIGDFSDAMVAFMDSMELSQIDVMGYYTGSLTAVDLAIRYPDRIRKVVMISAPIFNDDFRERYRPVLTRENSDFADTLTALANNIRRDPLGEFQDLPSTDRYADIMVETLRQYRTSNWGYRAAFAYDLTKTLPKVNQSVLVLNLDDFMKELTRLAEPYLKNGRIHELPGWNSGALDTYADEIAEIVRFFLSEELR